MSEQKFIYDASGTKIREVSVHDNETFTVTAHENLDPLLAYVKEAKENQRSTRETHYRHVATVPDFVFEQAIREGWANDKARWARWLNDPQNKPFRVWEGNISGREGI